MTIYIALFVPENDQQDSAGEKESNKEAKGSSFSDGAAITSGFNSPRIKRSSSFRKKNKNKKKKKVSISRSPRHSSR